MLPALLQMFALVRDLSNGRQVNEVGLPPELVRRHNLGALAAQAGARRFHDDLVRSTVAWARLEQELPPIMERLARATVRVAPIKGVSYATRLYALPAERPMTDVDLLVERRRVREAGVVLVELGFSLVPSSSLHHASTWVRGSLVLDLHHGILGPGRSRVDFDAVWARTSHGWPPGAERLDHVDELVFHLVHMARNRLCGPLVQVVDTSHLIKRLPAGGMAQALARAEHWGISKAVGVALEFSRSIIFGRKRLEGMLAPPADDLLFVRQPRLARKILFDVLTAGSPRQLAARAIGAGAQRLVGVAHRNQIKD